MWKYTQDKIAHTTALSIPVVEHWLEQEIAQLVHHEGSIRLPITPRKDALPMSYISFLLCCDTIQGIAGRFKIVPLYLNWTSANHSYWLEREIAQLVHHEGSIRLPITPWEDALPRSYISLLLCCDTIQGIAGRFKIVPLYLNWTSANHSYWLEREIAQWVHHEGWIRRPITPWEDAVPRSYISFLFRVLLEYLK